MNRNGRRLGSVRGRKDVNKAGIRENLDLSIKVDVNGMTDSKKEEPHGSTATVVCQIVVVEKPVVDTLAGGTILVDLLELSRVSRNRRIKTDIIWGLNIEAATGFGR